MLMLAYGRGRWAVSQRRIMILESQPAWQAIPHDFVEKIGTRAKEWNEGGGGGLEKETKGWPPIVTCPP